MNITKRNKFELTEQANGTHRLFIYSSRLATKVNRILKSYPLTSFKQGNEAQFTLTQNDLSSISKTLGLK